MRAISRLLSASTAWLVVGSIATLTAAPQTTPQPERTGAELYGAACAACHGPDGRGQPPSVVGFAIPLPDLSDCGFASREPDADWLAVAHGGGPVRAFDRTMPAFGEALRAEELSRIMGHIRSWCAAATEWPRGELNLPRAFFVEKAYPEDEAVLTVSAATDGDAVDHTLVYEKRFGARNQVELKLPVPAVRDAGGWHGGPGDLAIGVKRAVYHSLERGRIFSVAGEIVLPTGRAADGLGKGTAVVEPFVSFGRILPANWFVQAQAGAEVPFDRDKAEPELFWRGVIGTSLSQHVYGRTWSPMVEVLGARELEEGQRVLWDVVPQVQISLSTRQHILFSAGLRLPVNARDGRSPRVLAYLLWDWFDGGLFDGW